MENSRASESNVVVNAKEGAGLGPHPTGVTTAVKQPRRFINDIVDPLTQVAESSPHFISHSPGMYSRDGVLVHLPRYVFKGPTGGGDTIRIGLFAAIHGDEPEGAVALLELARLLKAKPEIARGYALFLYPICNPTGFEDDTRHSRSRKDLNRYFWRQSYEPEIRFLESELTLHGFDGIINLHGDDTSDGIYGFVGGAVLTEHLLEPALKAAEHFLPRNRSNVIDGFNARSGIISDGYQGVLQNVPNTKIAPFEITFETPHLAPQELQVKAFLAAIESILSEYQKLIAVGANI